MTNPKTLEDAAEKMHNAKQAFLDAVKEYEKLSGRVLTSLDALRQDSFTGETTLDDIGTNWQRREVYLHNRRKIFPFSPPPLKPAA